MNKYSLNIACWNINGLDDDKLTDKDFEAFICKYDCVILLETFISNNKNIKQFHTYCLPAKKVARRGRSMGGTIILTKPDIRKHISFFKSKCDTFCWIKFERLYFSLRKDLYVCAAYIPPITSSSRTNDENKYIQFDILQEEHVFSIYK